MRDPARPESPFCADPAWPGPTGRIAASFCPADFRKKAPSRLKPGHVGHTCREVAWRSKPEGRDFLSLTRLVRRRKRAGRSADDAVLTLKSFFLATPAEPRINNSKFFSGALRGSGDVTRHWRLGQLTKRRSRTCITRPIARKTNNVAEPP